MSSHQTTNSDWLELTNMFSCTEMDRNETKWTGMETWRDKDRYVKGTSISSHYWLALHAYKIYLFIYIWKLSIVQFPSSMMLLLLLLLLLLLSLKSKLSQLFPRSLASLSSIILGMKNQRHDWMKIFLSCDLHWVLFTDMGHVPPKCEKIQTIGCRTVF